MDHDTRLILGALPFVHGVLGIAQRTPPGKAPAIVAAVRPPSAETLAIQPQKDDARLEDAGRGGSLFSWKDSVWCLKVTCSQFDISDTG